MKKIFLIPLMSLAVGGLLFCGVPTSRAASGKGDKALAAATVASAPKDAASPEWQKAKAANLVLTGAGRFEGKKLDLEIKAVHTKDMVFFRYSWPDQEKSMSKKEWSMKNGAWTAKKADEDRLGVAFEINRVNKFATKGCAVFCHNQSKNEKEWYFSVDTAREKADLWHWKAVRSNPVGFTEDGYLTTNPAQKPEEGRKRDSGEGKAKSNKTEDKSKPAFMQDPGKKASVPGSLLTTEAVKITDYSSFKDGDVIPGYMVNPAWSGSFADVKTIGVWENGRWTVFMSRKLDTGNEDDVQFNPRKKYPFGVAVFDNSHEHDSYNSEPLVLSFK